MLTALKNLLFKEADVNTSFALTICQPSVMIGYSHIQHGVYAL
jgi:hypothetical protein